MKAALVGGGLLVLTVVWLLLPRLPWGMKDAPPSLGNARFAPLTEQAGEEIQPSLSPDGKSVVYASNAAGNWDLYVQRVGGSNPINLTPDCPVADGQPAFSPDGERIAFRSSRNGGGLFLMGATGEAVRRLTDFGYNPAWSPDEKHLVFATQSVSHEARLPTSSHLWTVDVATGQTHLITREDAAQPHWSPQGHRIAYWGYRRGGQRDLWTVPAAGGAPVAVTDDLFEDWNPVWAPDGRYLYFVSDRGGSMNLWRVPMEETTGRVLGPPESVTTPSSRTLHFSFSRDGRRIAYVQAMRQSRIQKVEFDPIKETVVGQPARMISGSKPAQSPTLSPDGEWMAFVSSTGNQGDLFVIKRDGTGLRQLTDDLYYDRGPQWSPTGERIAFYSDRSGQHQIWTIRPDGSQLQQRTQVSDTAIYPVWSPDGKRLVYRTRHDSFIIDMGKPWREQSPHKLPLVDGPESGFIVFSWSPDGRTLAGRMTSLGQGVALFSLANQRYELLTDFGDVPHWLSDDRRLLFRHGDKLYLVDRRSKNVREVLSTAPHDVIRYALSRDDRLIYFEVLRHDSDIWLMSIEPER